MPNISLKTATLLTGLSMRTLRRRITDGTIKCADNNTANNRTMICLDSIKNDIGIALEPDDIELIKAADAGDARMHKMIWRCFFWKKINRKVPFVGWNWRQSKTLPMRCTCWEVVI